MNGVNDEKMLREQSAEAMKPETAAKKLGIYLPATPEEFQRTALTHSEFVSLQADPPEWLRELRRTGPHPRPEVARRLGITIAALKRNDLDRPLTTAEIKELLENQPEWLREARLSLATQRGHGTDDAQADEAHAAGAQES